MRLARRAIRGFTLLGQWASHIARDRDAGALRDFVFWVRTSLFRADMVDLDLTWFTFAATRHLAARIQPGLTIFEWGSGASTIFFARRGCRVWAAESDPVWLGLIAQRLEPEQDVQLLSFDGATDSYVEAVRMGPCEGFDLIVVDGRRRIDCLRRGIERLRPGGTLILDDSDRAEYQSALASLPEAEWNVQHFAGPKPAVLWPVFTRTSLFEHRRPRGHRAS